MSADLAVDCLSILVDDINPGEGASVHNGFSAPGDQLLLSANGGISGFEPWISDGTAAGTYLVIECQCHSAVAYRCSRMLYKSGKNAQGNGEAKDLGTAQRSVSARAAIKPTKASQSRWALPVD
ncbi:hypothetical protein C8255_03970 [filamentous cyanobacterium CCP3]|nr:hypothetical protein C8255_03970 [filamentous cyanobacterium CCP3]